MYIDFEDYRPETPRVEGALSGGTVVLISWTLRPVRVLRLVRALVTGRQESRLDKSLIEMRRRVSRRWRERRPGLPVGELNPY